MTTTKDAQDVNNLSKEELVHKVQQLEAHIVQLRNLLTKAREGENSKKRQSKHRPFDFNKYNTRHVALKIVYLGWDYQGFAVQEDTERTIEAALFAALTRTKLIENRETSCYHRCGRTDKGVSAFSQVISIDLRTNLLEGKGVKVKENGTAHERTGDKTNEIRYCYILNKVLPPEIRVLAWCPVQQDFSARFSCKGRMYKYFFPKGDLNVEVMREAAEKLRGEHDYRNFCKMDVGNGVTNYTRNITYTDVLMTNQSDLAGYEMVELTIKGQAFLWHQIRCIVAVLFLIGQGRETPQIIEELLNVEKHPRKPQYTMASELPLVLFDCSFEDVDWIYESDWHQDNLRHLQEQWTNHTVRASLVKKMLEELEAIPVGSTGTEKQPMRLQTQNECLLPGNKPRSYKPLMEREKCESLEERIQHYAKRRKIDTQEETK